MHSTTSNPSGNISIHSLRVEGDSPDNKTRQKRQTFQSTPSVWRETMPAGMMAGSASYFNPLPPCGGRRNQGGQSAQRDAISIHSLRVEGDNKQKPRKYGMGYFNPLPPCGGRHCLQGLVSAYVHFNPLPPCGGRHKRGKGAKRNEKFQSTPSVWRETLRRGAADGKNVFQSTPSVWRETRWYLCAVWTTHISIHSLRVEGDMQQRLSNATPSNFNPLPPCGGRPSLTTILTSTPQFQSTPSVWRETAGGAI